MTILNELHQDHINLNKILAILRLKVEKLRAGNHPDFSLMADVIDYISNYADAYHHRREDTLYKHFHGRSVELDQLLMGCEEEHLQMKASSTHLAETIDGILHDAVIPMDEFTDQLEAYLDQQDAHLNREEGSLFPMIQGVANDQDWEQLKTELPKSDDPLFGEKQAVQYTDLYKALIMDMAESKEA